MTKKALILIVGVVAFTFVAMAVYAATDTSPTPMNNTSTIAAEVCSKDCDKDCEKCEDCDGNCENCDGDCENCNKDCSDNCKKSGSCDKSCKGNGSGWCGCQGEGSGTCQTSQKPGMCGSQ